MLFAACGEGENEDPGNGATTVAITVTLDVDGEGGEAAREADVRCPGDEACDIAEQLRPADFAPVPRDQACTEIFGGPEVATIEGTVRGDDVNATFNRSNGCEIDRFGAIVPLLSDLFPGYEPGQTLAP